METIVQLEFAFLTTNDLTSHVPEYVTMTLSFLTGVIISYLLFF